MKKEYERWIVCAFNHCYTRLLQDSVLTDCCSFHMPLSYARDVAQLMRFTSKASREQQRLEW